MKKLLCVSLMVCLPGLTMAQEQAAEEQSGGAWLQEFIENKPEGTNGATSAAIVLGGLFGLYLSEANQAATQSRVAQNDARLGNAGAILGMGGTPAALPDYEHFSNSLVMIPSARFLLSNEKTYITVTGTQIIARDDSGNPVTVDTGISQLGVGFQHYPRPDVLFAGAIEVERLGAEIDDGFIDVEREAINIRLDYLRRLTNEFGFATRLEYSDGTADVDVNLPPPPMGPGTLSSSDRADSLYWQGEGLYTLTEVDLDFIPQDWELNNRIGVNFLRNYTPDDNVDSGSVWGEVALAKQFKVNRFSPSVFLGVENEYEVSSADFIDDDTYLVFGGTFIRLGAGGSVTSAILERRQGFEGDRGATSLILSHTFEFD